MAHRRGLVAIAVACSLLGALLSVAEARPKTLPGAHHVAGSVLARQGDPPSAGASVPREPLGVEPVAVPLPTDATTATFVDPAGGHARVLPIETASPYRAP